MSIFAFIFYLSILFPWPILSRLTLDFAYETTMPFNESRSMCVGVYPPEQVIWFIREPGQIYTLNYGTQSWTHYNGGNRYWYCDQERGAFSYDAKKMFYWRFGGQVIDSFNMETLSFSYDYFTPNTTYNRYAPCMTISRDEEWLFITGGKKEFEGSVGSNITYFYNINSGEMNYFGPILNHERQSHSCVATPKYLYVFGAYNGGYWYIRNVERLDISDMESVIAGSVSWEFLAYTTWTSDDSVSSVFFPRVNWIDNLEAIIITGGAWDSTIYASTVILNETDGSSPKKWVVPANEMNLPRYKHAQVYIPALKKLWIIGGQTNDGVYATGTSERSVELNTESPSMSPTPKPTSGPTSVTASPTLSPSDSTGSPSVSPTPKPSPNPTEDPTRSPTLSPSISPTRSPTDSTGNPSVSPIPAPTDDPTKFPTQSPTKTPTDTSAGPSKSPTLHPTNHPSFTPTQNPSISTFPPTFSPTKMPSMSPSGTPTANPSTNPSMSPTNPPSFSPSGFPTFQITSDAPTHLELPESIEESNDQTISTTEESSSETKNKRESSQVSTIVFGLVIGGICAALVICLMIFYQYKEKKERSGTDVNATNEMVENHEKKDDKPVSSPVPEIEIQMKSSDPPMSGGPGSPVIDDDREGNEGARLPHNEDSEDEIEIKMSDDIVVNQVHLKVNSHGGGGAGHTFNDVENVMTAAFSTDRGPTGLPKPISTPGALGGTLGMPARSQTGGSIMGEGEGATQGEGGGDTGQQEGFISIEQMDLEGIANWIRNDPKVAQYESLFRENHVDGMVLAAFDDAKLEKLGVQSMGHRFYLVQKIQKWRQASGILHMDSGWAE